jgi:NAD(P)H-dependent flavin oxidoreductase YrpB (nitropropane dioxygenase family)
MGTRFIATQESEFEPVWKQAIIDREERQTLVGRGVFGPMRFLRNSRSEQLVEQTLKDLPAFYLGQPLDSNENILGIERSGFVDLMDAKPETALMLGGEVAGRVKDLPSVKDLIVSIIDEAVKTLELAPKRVKTKGSH